jgi:hypothetical protein
VKTRFHGFALKYNSCCYTTEVVGDNEGMFGAFACNRVCRHENASGTSVSASQMSTGGAVGVDILPPAERLLGRVELEVKCEAGVDCVIGEIKWWAPAKEAGKYL